MRNIITLFVVAGLLISGAGVAMAQTATSSEPVDAATITDLPDPGSVPGDPFYRFKRFSERIGLIFTFNSVNKADKISQLAERRLAEAKMLMEQEGEQRDVDDLMADYEDLMDDASERAIEAQNEGKRGAGDLLSRISEATMKHQGVLADVYERVPEQAKGAIERAMEASMRGHEGVMSALSGERRAEVEERIREAKSRVERRLNNLRSQGAPIPDIPVFDESTFDESVFGEDNQDGSPAEGEGQGEMRQATTSQGTPPFDSDEEIPGGGSNNGGPNF